MTVTSPQGFRAAGIAAGIKSNGNPDLALIVNDGPSDSAAAVFTSNRVKAAPVVWSEQVLKAGRLGAVVLNSGGANACTGSRGFADTHATAERVAERLGIGAAEVAVCSTGLIGELLPMEAVLSGVDTAVGALSADGGPDAAVAIMTTDTRAKNVAITGDGYTIGGMAKGAGMLAPGLATMLVTITTDADLDSSTLDASLRAATAVTFDRLDSDGCMSTNDAVIVMASGASGVTPSAEEFTETLTALCRDLAQQLQSDAEGASKDIAITIVNAATEAEAVDVGRTVARSNLLKCALFGNDPNWGRVLAAVGTTSAAFDPDQLDVAMNGVWVCKNGSVGAPRSDVDLSGRAVDIIVDLHAGDSQATIWTNDLTTDYVHENSAYSS